MRSFFFFNDTATTEIYTLSLHDALPICRDQAQGVVGGGAVASVGGGFGLGVAQGVAGVGDRKSTRLNSSHGYISYAVFCLKKKKHPRTRTPAACASAQTTLRSPAR